MRIVWVIIGVVVLIIGVVLSFVPVVQAASQGLTPSSPLYEANVTGYSISGSVPVTITWTSSSSVEAAAGTCQHPVGSSSGCGTNTTATESGTSGTFNLNVPNGGSFGVAVFGGGVTFSGGYANITVKVAESTIGLVLIIFGIILLIVGVVMKKKIPKAAPAPAPMPATPDPQPMAPPPPQ